MDITEIQRKILKLSNALSITPDAFDAKADGQELERNVMEILKEHPRLFRGFLFKIFDLRVKYTLEEKFDLIKIQNEDQLNNLFSKGGLNAVFRVLESETGLLFPKPVFSRKSIIFQLALVLIPAGVFIGFVLLNFAILTAVYGLLTFGALLFFVLVPYLTVYFFFPRLFQPNKFHKINTYQDLIDDLVWTNQFVFIADDYKLTNQELVKFLESL